MTNEEYRNLYSDANTYSRPKLEKTVRTLAKRANTRMRELEKQGLEQSSFAYRKNLDLLETRPDVFKKDWKDRVAYRTDVSNLTFQELKSEMALLRGFLFQSSTSTPKGIRETVDKRVNTFNEARDTKITAAQFAEIFELNNITTAINRFGSEVITRLVDAEGNYVPKEKLEEILNSVIENGRSYRQFERSINEAVEEYRKQETKIPQDLGDFQSI